MRASLTTLISLSVIALVASSCSSGDGDDQIATVTDAEDTSTTATDSDEPSDPAATSSGTGSSQGGTNPTTTEQTEDDDSAEATPTATNTGSGSSDEELGDTSEETVAESDSDEGSTDTGEATDTDPATETDADEPTSDEPTDPALAELEPFSFFVTSLAALQDLSGSDDGFGGDLRYGEADGLTGADKICTEIAERSMPGSGAKEWHAFLSVTAGGVEGGPIHAIDRVGEGPWYDRLGRVIALDKDALVNQRPEGIDPEIELDLPNEDGVPNHAPDGELVDNHDMLTGTNDQGQLYTEDGDPSAATCNDWTSAEPSGAPRVGHPWPTGAGGGGFGGGGGGGRPTGGGGGGGGSFGDMANWMSALTEAGCAPGVFLVEMGGPKADNPTVGSGGGYGGFYCFAMNP